MISNWKSTKYSEQIWEDNKIQFKYRNHEQIESNLFESDTSQMLSLKVLSNKVLLNMC